MVVLWLSFVASGCASRAPVGNEFCVVSSPIYIAEGDFLTQRTADKLLAHNELGERLCDWPGADD